ncbi:MAG: hypothetical protein ACRCVE_01945 [Plesiomonas sp.]
MAYRTQTGAIEIALVCNRIANDAAQITGMNNPVYMSEGTAAEIEKMKAKIRKDLAQAMAALNALPTAEAHGAAIMDEVK